MARFRQRTWEPVLLMLPPAVLLFFPPYVSGLEVQAEDTLAISHRRRLGQPFVRRWTRLGGGGGGWRYCYLSVSLPLPLVGPLIAGFRASCSPLTFNLAVKATKVLQLWQESPTAIVLSGGRGLSLGRANLSQRGARRQARTQ